MHTGSYSLRLALEQLGFSPCFHIIDIMGDEDKANALMWWKGLDQRLKADKQSVDFDEFYGDLAHGARAAVDWPTFFYWRELAEYYPTLKLIVTVRDKEKWYQSCIAALNLYFYNPMLRVMVALKLVDLIHFVATELIPKSVEEFGGIDVFYNEKQRVFDHVDRRIAEMMNDERYKNRVLIFRVKEGWQPLCRFLNVKVPNTPFPRSNDGAALARNVTKYMWKCMQKLAVHYLLILVMAVFVVFALKGLVFNRFSV